MPNIDIMHGVARVIGTRADCNFAAPKGHEICPGAVLGKNIGGGGWPLIIWEATTSRTTVSNCPVGLLSNLCTVITLKILGAWARFFWRGEAVSPGPNLEPPLDMPDAPLITTSFAAPF